jgi:seryl-tRNA synthetase
MLTVSFLENNKEKVLKGLAKRNFKKIELIDSVLELDYKRKEIQTKKEVAQAESNSLAKEIGTLYKSGQAEQAN